MTRLIPLTKGKVAIVDRDDYDWLCQWRWVFSSNGYAMRTITENGRRRFFQMHRVIMGAQRGQLVDHIDGNRLNNTRDNLRIVTRSQNNWNRRPNKGHRYKGVYSHARGWHARIRYLNKRIHLGYFDDPVTAARVYDAAALHLFGHFARPNFPDEPVSEDIQAQLLRILERHSLT
jgi:hypothetical protein